ncbi:hypothetical protein KAI04_04355 [Candidatus Pacearchaeota archaeon]|nr:hypothetical protein [Candidatus Pacearchaeota archaeon]
MAYKKGKGMTGKNHSLETKNKISKSNKGKLKGLKQTEEHKRKRSESMKGKNKGQIAWNKGLTKKTDIRVKKYANSLNGHKVFGGFETRFKKGDKRTNNSIEKQRNKILGPNNHNWQGGKSFEPYGFEFNNKLKKTIKERDDNKCFICENKINLAIHHIDYNKKNNNPNNLITLCNSCHSKTNYKRSYWIGFFKEVMQ